MRHRRELKKWKSVREKELLEEERNELEREEAKIKQKVQADIDLVARKLNEESREKRQQQALEMNEKYRVSEILLSLFRYFFPVHTYVTDILSSYSLAITSLFNFLYKRSWNRYNQTSIEPSTKAPCSLEERRKNHPALLAFKRK